MYVSGSRLINEIFSRCGFDFLFSLVDTEWTCLDIKNMLIRGRYNYKGHFAADLIRSSLINKNENVLAVKKTYSGINIIECNCNSPKAQCSLSIMIGHTIHMPQNKTLFFHKKEKALTVKLTNVDKWIL